MHFMGVEDGLFRHVVLLAAQAYSALAGEITAYDKKENDAECDVSLVLVEGNGLQLFMAFFLGSQFVQVAVDLHQYYCYHGEDQGDHTKKEAVAAGIFRSCSTFTGSVARFGSAR